MIVPATAGRLIRRTRFEITLAFADRPSNIVKRRVGRPPVSLMTARNRAESDLQ